MNAAITGAALLYPGRLHADGAEGPALERLRARHPGVEFHRAPYDAEAALAAGSAPSGLTAEVVAALGRAEAVLCLDLPAPVLELAPRLRWVQSAATGVERLPLAALRAAGVVVSNAAGTAAPEIAEFVLARILEDRKRLPELAALAAERAWRPVYGAGLSGVPLGLVGFGAINRRVARLAAAFGMEVHVCRRRGGPPPEGVRRVHPLPELNTMLARCEIVVAALPETPETIGLLGREALAALPRGALLLNVGRGSAVDEPALLDALARGSLRAVLDVAAREPLPPGDPLWDAPGVRISAHCSSVPSAGVERVLELFGDGLSRWEAGEAPTHQI